MVDFVLLALLIATAVLFSALALDEVTSRTSIRRSNRTSLVRPREVAKRPAIQPEDDDRDREAA
jgi:hypothetical protein